MKKKKKKRCHRDTDAEIILRAPNEYIPDSEVMRIHGAPKHFKSSNNALVSMSSEWQRDMYGKLYKRKEGKRLDILIEYGKSACVYLGIDEKNFKVIDGDGLPFA